MIISMPKRPTPRVVQLREILAARLKGYSPGTRFLSNRAISQRFGVSYQTADRIVREMVSDGLLQRRQGSGTFVSGDFSTPARVALCTHPRARLAGTFGAHLVQMLREAFAGADMPLRVLYEEEQRLQDDEYPVIWELPSLVEAAAGARRRCLVLLSGPPLGEAARHVDSLTIDDYSGGYTAGQILRGRLPHTARCAILAGPKRDVRSRRRVEGFQLLWPKARVIHAPSWQREGAEKQAASLMRSLPEGIFCVNDRLAEEVLTAYRSAGKTAPLIVGFDNAPVAESLQITTVAIPWPAFIREALLRVRAALGGDRSPCRQTVLPVDPLYRLTA
ncbi:MAG: hypothetical protein BGO12_12290 [Verrucomicrobia bacterium 61-8]|nr:MAG: hypothetical protein BGO12_12290 [Verrucomicrobia bacterium 61-8]